MKKSIWIISLVIIILLLVFGTISVFYLYPRKQVIVSSQTLDFCSTEQKCRDFFVSQGLPQDYLDKNDIEINCNEEGCYGKK